MKEKLKGKKDFKKYLESKKTLDIRYKRSNTILHLAINKGYSDIVSLLL